MARHRSPQSRRAHLGPPLSALVAAAGVGGAHRSVPLPQLTSSLPVRFVATAVAGTALAAAGQHALADALPLAADGASMLRLGVDDVFGTQPTDVVAASSSLSAPLVAEPIRATVEPVVPEFVVADAAGLVKAADAQRVAAETAARVAEATAKAEEKVRAERAVRAVEAARTAPAAAASAAGGVQLVVGRVTSGFGARSGRQHQGLDIAAPIGTPIRAPLAGRVIDSGPASGFGLWVQLEHSDGTVTTYGHVNRTLVRVGQQVGAGEVIAEVGNRGQSSGAHLHFEVQTPGGQKINPRPWLDERGIRLT